MVRHRFSCEFHPCVKLLHRRPCLVEDHRVVVKHCCQKINMTFYADNHVKYIQSLDKRQDELEYWLTEHLRLSAVYWGWTALHILSRPDALDREKLLEYVKSCQNEDGKYLVTSYLISRWIRRASRS